MLFDRIHGGWIGRCLGVHEARRGSGAGLAEDRSDAVDRAVLSLRVLELYGPGFTSAQVGGLWLLTMPFLRPFGAEQAAFLRLLEGELPPATAGDGSGSGASGEAMMRADLYGYVAPGDPRRAARLARKDAVVSHAGEGMYAAMWCAALAAAAFTARDVVQAVGVSLRHVPVESGVSRVVRDVLVAYARGWAWDQVVADVGPGSGSDDRHDASASAGLIAAGLLWGGTDPARQIGLAVRDEWDVHAIAPLVGSIAGVLYGAEAGWPAEAATRVETALPGEAACALRELARRTLAVSGTELPLR
ncbi:ADP-ribosylglycohydrolase family protein [Embleya sp. NPDC056538]|uniref:ADP-ribosylglycohydrolase family protein n=1 Tax=Embleya sp. NPDC056538 TaxID=3345858 RepID=UPI0036C1E420